MLACCAQILILVSVSWDKATDSQIPMCNLRLGRWGLYLKIRSPKLISKHPTCLCLDDIIFLTLEGGWPIFDFARWSAFSPTRPSWLSWSSSRDVCLFVCLIPIFHFAGWGAFFHWRDPSIWANMLIIYPPIGICSITDVSYCIPPPSNIPLAPRKYWRVWFQYSIVKNDIMNNNRSTCFLFSCPEQL